MTGRVGDDEFSLGGREITIRHINRDALLTLFFQTVGQQRRIESATGGPVDGRVLFDFGQLIFVDHFRIVQQATDQGTLAIVDATTGQKTQQLLTLVLLEVRVDISFD